jgi:hypothetical protein
MARARARLGESSTIMNARAATVLRELASLLPFRPSPAWWLLRSDQTRSHPELGRQTLQHQWY